MRRTWQLAALIFGSLTCDECLGFRGVQIRTRHLKPITPQRSKATGRIQSTRFDSSMASKDGQSPSEKKKGKSGVESELEPASPSFDTTRKSPYRAAGKRYETMYASSEFGHLIRTWGNSYVLSRVRQPILIFTYWAFALAMVQALCLCAGWPFNPPVWLFGQNPRRGLAQALSLCGGTISLLLVFRTNTAYNRFWEGRKIWETISSVTRATASLTDAYAEEFGRRRCRKMGALLGAFPVALQLHLQGVRSEDPESEVRKLFRALGGGGSTTTSRWGLGAWRAPSSQGASKLSYDAKIPYDNFVAALHDNNDMLAAKIDLPTDLSVDIALNQLHRLKYGTSRDEGEGVSLQELSAYYSPLQLQRMLPMFPRSKSVTPLAITREMLAVVKSVPYDEGLVKFTSRERLTFMGSVHKLQACIAAAERIVQTPVPLHYMRFTTRFISAWCFALPLCLVQSMGFLVVPLMSVVVWALFGLREIGILIENPFQRSLQLRIVSDSIRADVNKMLNEQEK